MRRSVLYYNSDYCRYYITIQQGGDFLSVLYYNYTGDKMHKIRHYILLLFPICTDARKSGIISTEIEVSTLGGWLWKKLLFLLM